MRPGGIGLVGLIVLVALLVLSAPSVNAASFDCSRASVRAEFLVCGNPELSALDDRMAVAYAAARRDAIDPSAVITLDFTVDSGATDVAIPADVVLTLIRTRTITDDDFMGNRTYTMADGSTAPSTIFRIRSLKVGNKVLHDVTASIA
jgi:hypothetical protein